MIKWLVRPLPIRPIVSIFGGPFRSVFLADKNYVTALTAKCQADIWLKARANMIRKNAIARHTAWLRVRRMITNDVIRTTKAKINVIPITLPP
jgi:hypothetical protein